MSEHTRPINAAGLTAHEANSRLARDGPNLLPSPPAPSALRRFVGELTHFFALMLWAAGLLALVAGLTVLGLAIFAVVLLNGGFAFVQEQRAARAADRLRALLPSLVTVRRDGRPQRVDAEDVVEGDVLILESGDRIPADAATLSSNDLALDVSLLTGESEAAHVQPGAAVFAGTFIVEGDGEAVVTATGPRTRLAGIATLAASAAKPSTPLTRELTHVVRVIALVALGVGAGFFGLSWLIGNDLEDGFVFAIGVTVALVPEALLPTVTLSLAWGAEQMVHRHVLVRNLEAVETLGSTTFVCTDKTGTLTANQMSVVEAWTGGGMAIVTGNGYEPHASVVVSDPLATSSLVDLGLAASRCSTGYVVRLPDGWGPRGDPMEAAIDVFARRLGTDTDRDRADYPPSRRFPFDPRRRRMSVIVDGQVVVKGAPDGVLPLCSNGDAAAYALESMTNKGLRVIAVAGRPVDHAADDAVDDADMIETSLELYGLLGLEDPPRPDVHEAIAACRRAGIKVAMITGDHPATASAIADQVGLAGPERLVVTGDQLPEDPELLGALLDRDGIVVARVSPEDKLRIATALQARGHIVAMTGDGVNDAPALTAADIGIAMGRSGTDVAREAADLVLLDDHFASIVAGVEQGRATFVNIRKFLTYHLTDNVAELTPFLVWALSGGQFPLALGVLQILALDLGTDTLSAVALGAEPPARHALDGPPISGRLLDHTVARRAFGLLGPTVALLTMTAFVAALIVSGWRPGGDFPSDEVIAAASGAAFMAVVFAQTANAFACRSSTRWPGALGWTTNRLLPVAVTIELVFSLLVLFVAPIASQLDQRNPPLAGWLVVLAAGPVLLIVDWIDKKRRAGRPSSP